MKKLILFWGLTLGLSGLSYGMDFVDQAGLDTFKKMLEEKNWFSLVTELKHAQPALRSQCEKLLLQKDISDLNAIEGVNGLFQQVFLEYYHASRNNDKDLKFWEGLLKNLILKGLDFMVIKDGHYLYKYNSVQKSNCQHREALFIRLFNDIVTENPDKKEQLMQKFKPAVPAPAPQNPDVAFSARMARNYALIGCGSVVVCLLLYAAYVQRNVDNDQEEDAEDGQQTQQEADVAEHITA